MIECVNTGLLKIRVIRVICGKKSQWIIKSQ